MKSKEVRNMAEIYVNIDVIKDTVSKLNNVGAQLESVLAKIQRVVDAVLINWNGKAKDSFLAAFDAKKSAYIEMGIDISQFSTFIMEYADRIIDTDSEFARRWDPTVESDFGGKMKKI